MTRSTKISRESLVELATKLAGLREKALTEDENTLLTLKMEGKTDAQVAAVFGISIPVTNQKKHKLYALINGLSWWIDQRGSILQNLEEAVVNKESPMEASLVFDLVATRYTKNDIAAELKLSAWKVTRAIDFTLARFADDLEFREFFESLRLGYKLPWKGGVEIMEETKAPEPEETVEETTEEVAEHAEHAEAPATEETEEAPATEREIEFPQADATEESAEEPVEESPQTEEAEADSAPAEEDPADESPAEEPVAETEEPKDDRAF